MSPCRCPEPHARRRIVLTGGPGAGKTAVLEFVRRCVCRHVTVLPEAASILFGGGFRRGATVAGLEATQRAIYHVQRELEVVAEAEDGPTVQLCDRGTVDGFAYWPPQTDYWSSLGTTRERELRGYDAVIHLRTPPIENGYNHQNPVRLESALEAAAVDQRIAAAWHGHPRLFVVESTPVFATKLQQAVELLRAELPECCREHWPAP